MKTRYQSPDELYDYSGFYNGLITFVWFQGKLFYSQIKTDTHIHTIAQNKFVLDGLKKIYGEPSEKNDDFVIAKNYRNRPDIDDHIVMGRIGYSKYDNEILISFWGNEKTAYSMLKKEIVPCLKAIENANLINSGASEKQAVDDINREIRRLQRVIKSIQSRESIYEKMTPKEAEEAIKYRQDEIEDQQKLLNQTKNDKKIFVSTEYSGTVPIEEIMSGSTITKKIIKYHPTQGVPMPDGPKKDIPDYTYLTNKQNIANIRSLVGQRSAYLGKMGETLISFKNWLMSEESTSLRPKNHRWPNR